MNQVDTETFDTVAQLSHFGWGALVIMAPYALGLPICWTLLSVPLFILIAAIKEFWWDENYEPPEIRLSNVRDFAYYSMGIGSAAIALLIRWKLFA